MLSYDEPLLVLQRSGRWNLQSLTKSVRGVSVLAVYSNKQNRTMLLVMRWLPTPVVIASLDLPGIALETVTWAGGPVISSCWHDGKRRLIRWEVAADVFDGAGRVMEVIRRVFEARSGTPTLNSLIELVPPSNRFQLAVEDDRPCSPAVTMWVPAPSMAPICAVDVSANVVAFACTVRVC